LCIGASLGGAVYPEHGSTPEQLIKHADVAMYRAKAAGRGAYVVFDGGMQAASLEKLELENDLRNALDRGEFACVFQPIVGRSHRIVGCEALLRWENPQRADLDPAVFVGMLEEMGAIVQVTRWILETAIAFASRVRKKRPDFRIAVNVSGRDLYDPHLALFVGDLLQRTNMAPSGLELEVTESVLLDERAIRTLEQLRALGVRIAVDDFGVSYSVLSCVKRLPITTLKIDRSFVEGVVTSVPDQAIIKAIVALSKALGLRVIAEGIESEVQLRYVADLDVDEMQGFYIGHPLSEALFIAMFDKVVAIERGAEGRTQSA
jgi:EAL domain-containing protein (putative c-di-GMP-specific phosphodiesterase class I)